MIPSTSVSEKISFAASGSISDRPRRGISSSSSFVEGVSWYSFNSFVCRTRSRISSWESPALYSASFSAVSASSLAVMFRSGLKITRAS